MCCWLEGDRQMLEHLTYMTLLHCNYLLELSTGALSALQGKLKCIKDRSYDMLTQVR